jgi:hypothetical protein
MLRFLSFIERRDDLDLAGFSRHWRTVHRELALRLADVGIMRGYVQNHRRDMAVPGLTPPGDGVPELWVDDADTLTRLATSPAYLDGAALDEKNFMSRSARPFLAHSLVRPNSRPRQDVIGHVKLMIFYAARVATDSSRFSDAWLANGPFLGLDGTLSRGELHVALRNPGIQSEFTHCEALWWASREEFERAWSRRDPAKAARLLNLASIAGMLVEEVPVLWPEK